MTHAFLGMVQMVTGRRSELVSGKKIIQIKRTMERFDLIHSMPAHSIQLFSCILQKIHVHRLLKYEFVEISLESLVESYGLTTEVKKITHEDCIDVAKLLQYRGYTVTLFQNDAAKTFSVAWSEHTCVHEDGTQHFPALMPLEDVCIVKIPNKI